MNKICVLVLILSLWLQSCKKDDFSCNYDRCANKAPNSEIATLQDYITTNSITATQHCSGVFFNIISMGTGKNPTPCTNISFKYKGSLTNGTVFDQSSTAIKYNLGELVPAWRNVLPELKAGGKMMMYVPPTLGYGSQGNGPIPANSILIFEVDLVAVD